MDIPYYIQKMQDGDDDMFSSDLSVEERQFRLGHMASYPQRCFFPGPTSMCPRAEVDLLPRNLLLGSERGFRTQGPLKGEDRERDD